MEILKAVNTSPKQFSHIQSFNKAVVLSDVKTAIQAIRTYTPANTRMTKFTTE
jgi:hypothetical protein